MLTIALPGVRLAAVYGCLPPDRLDNLTTLQQLYGDEAQGVVRSTGITTRYLAREGISSLDLCLEAAQALLVATNYNLSQLAGIVSVTFTPAFPLPGNATLAQGRLGLSSQVAALDLHSHCAGYPYGLWVAASLARATGKGVLLLTGDVQSPLISPQDPASYPVFSDAGSATLIVPGGEDIWQFAFYSDGTKSQALHIVAGGSQHPLQQEHLHLQPAGAGARRPVDFAMDGLEVFKFVTVAVRRFMADFLAATGKSAADFAAFIPHQANGYMVRQLAKKLGFSEEQLWLTVERYGNGAAASIPLTIADIAPAKLSLAKSPWSSLLVGFGAGLAVAAVSLPLYAHASYGVVSYQG
ncbi:MAG: hypothetical protein FWF06_00225 [Symbiobacteriaceae bacterium]|nr:hypothetical protein [Symbiobacteriaceae bacterium]